jgi:anti-sigma regulatory factor (Ser/Thr protein kinase)
MAAEEQSGPVTSQPDPPEITCDLDQTSTSGLRQHLRDLLSERDDLMVDDAILVADELATNAIRHGQAPRQCRLMLTEQGRRLRIEVDDAAPTQPRMRTPDRHGGRGLVLVDRLAASWGTLRSPSHKTVWAELTLGRSGRGGHASHLASRREPRDEGPSSSDSS